MHDTLTIPKRDREHERLIGIVFDLSPSQSTLLSCLLRVAVATTDELQEYSDMTSPIKVAVSRTRTKLKSHGYDIHSKMDVGYWVEADDKRAIEKMLQKFVEGR